MAYVYRHIRLDKNIPFYIGISRKQDGYARAKTSFGRNPHWHKIINKTEWAIDILFDDVDYDFAKQKEIEFIEIYKRTIDGGSLANITKGGDGVTGFKNVKLSERNKSGIWAGKKHSEETKIRMSAASKGRVVSEKTRAKQSVFRKGKYIDESNPNYRGFIYIYDTSLRLLNKCYSVKDASLCLSVKSSGNVSRFLSRVINGLGKIVTRSNWMSGDYNIEAAKVLRSDKIKFYQVLSQSEYREAMNDRIAKSKKGLKMPPRTDEYREKLRIATTGRRHTDETKKKMSNTKQLKKLIRNKVL